MDDVHFLVKWIKAKKRNKCMNIFPSVEARVNKELFSLWKKNTSGGASTSLSPQQIVEETRHQILIKSNQAEQKLILRAAPLDLDSGEISYNHQ